ncbi:MAG: MBL fold metallo-hydrolase [Lachnospiraceae bacterium]|nr:MBL fold metallo-hydrolase [Lachnospiraceae bacterium]
MLLKVIATGSTANCYVIETPTQSLILDAGVAYKKLLPHIGNLRNVAGCLVTHRHMDHARGATSFSDHGIDVYMSPGEAAGIPCKFVKGNTLYGIGDFDVLPFAVEHDTPEPLGFLVRYVPTGELLLYATDTYYLRWVFADVNYWVIECNYCSDILDRQLGTGEIADALCRRLKKSHMSLETLKIALNANDMSKASKIVLVHLSDERSDKARMEREIHDLTGVDTVAADNGMYIDLRRDPCAGA